MFYKTIKAFQIPGVNSTVAAVINIQFQFQFPKREWREMSQEGVSYKPSNICTINLKLKCIICIDGESVSL